MCEFFSCQSIASIDGKQHLYEVVFSALVGFSLLEKYPIFGRGTARSCRELYQKSKEPGKTQEYGFSPK
jgi:hypothetical protein